MTDKLTSEEIAELLEHPDELTPEQAARRDIDAIFAKHGPALRDAIRSLSPGIVSKYES